MDAKTKVVAAPKKKSAVVREGLAALAAIGCGSLGCVVLVAAGIGVIYAVTWAISAGWSAGVGG